MPVVAVFTVPSKSPANVAPVYVPDIVTLDVKANVTVWPLPVVVIWFAVPAKVNAWLFNSTEPPPLPVRKSKSCESSILLAKAVVATLVELSEEACVVAVEPSGKTTPAVGNFKFITPILPATAVAVVSIWLAVPVILKSSLTRFKSKGCCF